MGFFDGMKINKIGQNAYNAHVQGNDYQRCGRVAEAKVKYDEAMKLYAEAYNAGCRKNGILMSYSVLMMRFGMFEEARELMKEISQIGKMNEDTHFELRVNYSICLWRLGILDKAIETIRYAGKHCKNSSYYSSLGSYLVQMAGQTGEFEEARVLLDEAMEYDDADAATLDNYGEYYRLLGVKTAAEGDAEEAVKMRAKAKNYFERALKAKANQVTTLYALAKFAIEDGETARARELLDKAILHSSSRICPVSIEELQQMKSELA